LPRIRFAVAGAVGVVLASFTSYRLLWMWIFKTALNFLPLFSVFLARYY
jgi:hypothetical protein